MTSVSHGLGVASRVLAYQRKLRGAPRARTMAILENSGSTLTEVGAGTRIDLGWVGLGGKRNEGQKGGGGGGGGTNTFLWSSSNHYCLHAHQFALLSPSLADNHDQSNMVNRLTLSPSIHSCLSCLVLVFKELLNTNPISPRCEGNRLVDTIHQFALFSSSADRQPCPVHRIDSPNTVSPFPPQRASDGNGGSTSTFACTSIRSD